MTARQISVFLENAAGRLAEVTRILADAEIDLRALTIADTADFGILRMIVDNVDAAIEVLEEKGFTAKVTEVLNLEIEDKPGGLASILEVFEKNELNIEYLYALPEKNKNNALVVFKVEDIERAKQIIRESKL